MVLPPCTVYLLWPSSSRTLAITVAPVPHNEGCWPVWCERTDSNRDATDMSSREMAQRQVPGTASGIFTWLPGRRGRRWMAKCLTDFFQALCVITM